MLRDGDFSAAVAVRAANCTSRFSLYGVTGPIIRFPYLRSSNSLYVLGPPLSARLYRTHHHRVVMRISNRSPRSQQDVTL